MRHGLHPLIALAVLSGVLATGCTTAVNGTPTAVPSSTPDAQVRLVLPDPPPWTPPAVVRELPEIVTPVNGAS